MIVVGLGAMGAATCCQLAARGVSVIGIDQYHPPHAHGSTHGETRITRLAIGEGPDYAPLVRRAHHLWREIEQQTETRLLNQSGGLILGHAINPFLCETRASARANQVDHENLSNAQLSSRFPMFAVDADTEGYYEPAAGYISPEAAVTAQLTLARLHGARLRLGERVTSWTASPRGVSVRTDRDAYEADRLVLCAGPWISELFAEGEDIFAVYRQLLYWFPIRAGYEQLRRMPIFIWEYQGEKEEFRHGLGFYGFPAIDGPGGGVKVGTETYERTTRAREPHPPPTREEVDEMCRRHLAPHLPWLGSAPLRTASCLYTSTRAGRFVIDRHPDHESVLIVSPCSGHGFKHSPAIGESIAQWLTEGVSEIDLGGFALSGARR